MKTGKKVSKIKIGDEVILTWIKCMGLNGVGAKYSFGKKTINSGPVSTFSNYSIVSENRLVKKPKSLDFDDAVLFGCALQTGAGIVINEMNISQMRT